MKKTLLLFLILLSSCGVIIDPIRVIGIWRLDRTEFYVYNPIIDSYKTYNSTDASPDLTHVHRGNFFGDKTQSKEDYYLIFKSSDTNDGQLVLSHKKDEDISTGIWLINPYENSLEIIMKKYVNDFDLWTNGFSFKNSWPLVNTTSMELLIKASDVGKNYFIVDLTDDIPLKVHSMKGFFIKDQ